MRRIQMWVLAIGGVVLGTMAYVGNSQATPADRFTGTNIGFGRFGEIQVRNHAIRDGANGTAKDLWLSLQTTKGASDLYVQSNTWEPGGTTGWHTHPGHSLIVVTEGAVSVYDGHDPTCTPKVYTVGMGFVDEGGDHVHVIRNEGGVRAKTIAVQLIPAGADRRIDAAAPTTCPF